VKNLPAACVGVLVAACLVGNANGGGGSIGEDAGARSTVNGAAEVQVTATAGKVRLRIRTTPAEVRGRNLPRLIGYPLTQRGSSPR